MIKRRLFIFLFMFILCISMLVSVKAADFKVSKEVVNDVVAIELTIPARYNINITNPYNSPTTFEFVTLLPAQMLPKEGITIPAGQSMVIPVSYLANYRVRLDINYEYWVRDNHDHSVRDTLFIKTLPISEILSVTVPTESSPEDVSLPVRIVNKENIDLGDVVVTADSDAFSSSTTVAIPANTAVIANIPLSGTKIKTSEAGKYDIDVTLYINKEYNYTIPGSINIKEVSNIIKEDKIKRSFFGYTKTLTRKNNGNIKELVTIELPYANFIEQTFTHFDIQPTGKLSSGSGVMWQRQLAPGESLTVNAITDYTLLIAIVALIVIAVVAYILFKRRKVLVSKKAIRIRTKGGEFAVKIIILMKNVSKQEVMNLNLVDSLPLTAQVYEKFGTVKPDKIDKHRLEWKFPSLLPGEEIVVSYILYSKINMVGSINLPQSSLSFTDFKNIRRVVPSNKLIVNASA
jgi:hypothetical protein